jgi:myo-inositol catabolism protein IolC
MDHRDSLQREIYGITGDPTLDEAAQISAGKDAIFDGLRAAIDGGVDVARVGVLVDERYGARVAALAKAAGIDLAMPIERSGQKLFLLEYGNFGDREWLQHVEQFDPDQVKVLVRDNPAAGGNRELQFDRLAAVSRALRESRRTFLIELLVPPVAAQLESVAGDALRYDREMRPELTVRVIDDMHEAGVEPEIWKIEGIETGDAATDVVAAARRDGRDDVTCIVLGRDAPRDRLDHWLTVAAGVEGFRGFAIGRSIWEQPLIDHLAGRATRADLVATVAENYTHFARVYDDAKR